ncbi:gamma-glutamyltransferase family protein, partial [Silanimonas sp.]|uniref:gamma-glutamyltransferase family protein n=1 Tax=Silanimonas sp. TaxID=1929290 RepID=UPI0037C9F768
MSFRPMLVAAALVLAAGLSSPMSLAREVPSAAGQRPDGAAVASANAQATDAGMEVLRKGGNAFDAAVAVSAALGLVEPESSGIGGGGFFLLRQASDGKVVFVDGRERAPLAATRDMFLDPATGEPRPRQTIDGPLAAAIPGLPAALVHVSKTYGRLPLADALAPAVALAEQGWTFGDKNLAMMGWREAALAVDAGAAPLLLVDGKTPALGTRMRNPDYAEVLKRLGRDGFDGFYRGDIATRLVDGVRAAGGLWTLEDLAQYRVVEREPLVFQHRGKTVVTAPPPSSGGIALAQTLQILDGYDWSKRSELDRLHLRIEAMRRAYRDRAVFLGDPDFVDVPVELLTNPAYAAGLRAG